jgi:hypothetical protein
VKLNLKLNLALNLLDPIITPCAVFRISTLSNSLSREAYVVPVESRLTENFPRLPAWYCGPGPAYPAAVSEKE